MLEDQILLEVDFNARGDADRVLGSLRFASSPRRPEIGEWIYLFDAEGNRCWGRLVVLEGLRAEIEPDWQSWVSGDGPQITYAVPDRHPDRSYRRVPSQTRASWPLEHALCGA